MNCRSRSISSVNICGESLFTESHEALSRCATLLEHQERIIQGQADHRRWPLRLEMGYEIPGNDLCLKTLVMVQRPRRVRKNMEIKMTSLSISRWFSLGALVLTISGTFSLSANGQTQATQPATQNVAVPDAGQKLLMAKADAAPAANLTAAEAATPAPATSAPVPPPAPSSYSWTGFHVGVNFGRGSSDTTTAVNPLPSAI